MKKLAILALAVVMIAAFTLPAAALAHEIKIVELADDDA